MKGKYNILPKGDNNEVYLYVRKKGDLKALYIFEDYKKINSLKNKENKFSESGDDSDVSKEIYICKLSNNNIKNGSLPKEISYIKYNDKEGRSNKMVENRPTSIEKIEKITGVLLGNLKGLDDDTISKIGNLKQEFKNI